MGGFAEHSCMETVLQRGWKESVTVEDRRQIVFFKTLSEAVLEPSMEVRVLVILAL